MHSSVKGHLDYSYLLEIVNNSYEHSNIYFKMFLSKLSVVCKNYDTKFFFCSSKLSNKILRNILQATETTSSQTNGF